jgi:hypothetical protein
VNWETVLTSAGVAAIVTAVVNLLGSHLQHSRQLELLRLEDARRLRDKRAERLRSHLQLLIEGAIVISESCRAEGTQERIDAVAARLNDQRLALNAERAAMVLDTAVVDLFVALGNLTALGSEVLALRRSGADPAVVEEKLTAVDAANAEFGKRSRTLLEGIETPI